MAQQGNLIQTPDALKYLEKLEQPVGTELYIEDGYMIMLTEVAGIGIEFPQYNTVH